MSHTESALGALRHVVATFAPSTASSSSVVEQLVQVVAEAFLSGTRLSESETMGSKEERQAGAVDLVDALFFRTDDVPALRETLQSAQMHPTVALFVQELLAMGIGGSADGQGKLSGSRSDKVHALNVLQRLVQRVGVDTCRRLLPGVVSQTVKYAVGCLSRCGSPQPNKLLVAVCDVLCAILQESFLLARGGGSSTERSTDPDSKWSATALAKMRPLLGALLDATLMSNVLPQLSLTLVESLRALCQTHREILSVAFLPQSSSGSSGECARQMERLVGLECFLDDVQHQSSIRRWGAAPHTQLLAEFARCATRGGPLSLFHLSLFKCALELAVPQTSDADTCASTGVTEAAEELVFGNGNGVEEAGGDASLMWSIARRVIRLVASHTDWEQWMTRTPLETLEKESSKAQRRAAPKTCLQLVDELLLVMGRVARAGRGSATGSQLLILQERALALLDDWSRYDLHPTTLYVYSRLHVFGLLGHPTLESVGLATRSDSSNSALLSQFVRQGEFESLWEGVLCRPHLWRIEDSISECTVQQQQHRALVARVILCVLRVLVEALGARMVVLSSSSTSGPTSRRLDGASQRVAKRVTLLTLYDVLEKGSSNLSGVREAADETLRAVVRHLHHSHAAASEGNSSSGDTKSDATRFFAAYGRFVVDEASRAVQDDELYPSAVNVLCGFCRFLENNLASGESSQRRAAPRPDEQPSGVNPDDDCLSSAAPLLLAVLDVAQQSWRTSSVGGGAGPSRRAHGMLQVMTTVASAGRRLLDRCPASLRCYPAEDDWDDERKWTVKDGDLALLQQKLYEALDFVFGKCNAARSPEVVQGVTFSMKVLSHFLQPNGQHVVRTHLNTVHRTHLALTRWLTGSWSVPRDEAVALLPFAALCAAPAGSQSIAHADCTAALSPKHVLPPSPGSKRTKRSTLLAKGRWLATADIPVETPAVIQSGLRPLLDLAPEFLCARMVDETTPLVLVWYVRAVWLSSNSALQTGREASTRSACVEFFRALHACCALHLSAGAQQELTCRCRGIVRHSDWDELYAEGQV